MSRKGNNKGQAQSQAVPQRETRPPESQPTNTAAGHESLIDPSSANGNGNRISDRNSDAQIFSSEEIAERAYQIFEREGRMDGRDMEHWLQAERELRSERERRPQMNAQNSPRSARQHQQS